MADAQGEFASGHAVHGDNDGSAKDASEKGDDPLGAVVSPHDYTIALRDAARFEFAGEPVCGTGDFAICPSQGTVSAMVHVGNFAAAVLERVDEWNQGLAGHCK